jgi:cell division protease FtsH
LCGENIARASIIGSVGGVGGAVFQAEKDASGLTTKTEYENQIKICYAGRAAEKVFLDDISDGAGSDITKATQLLNAYVAQVGMDDGFGVLDVKVLCPNMIESPAFSRIQKLSEKFAMDAEQILLKNMGLVTAVAKALRELETLSGDEVVTIIRQAETSG